MLPPQSAGPDRRPGADREASAGACDRGKSGACNAFRAGEPHYVRPDAVRDPELRPTGDAGSARTGVIEAWFREAYSERPERRAAGDGALRLSADLAARVRARAVAVR